MSPEQERKKEEAKRESEEKTYDVNAAGDKVALNRYSDAHTSNCINNY